MNRNNLSEPSLCKNNCGFFGSPQFKNYCSKCFNDLTNKANKNDDITVKEKTDTQIEGTKSLNNNNNSSNIVKLDVMNNDNNIKNEPTRKLKKKNVCSMEGCRKKLTLTSVECKCGYSFCSLHRYAEQHNCQFDYKGAKQDYLKKMNPQVAPSKITEI